MVCEQKYILVKLDSDCNYIYRTVMVDSSGKKYIKHSGKDVYLSTIRGKYRYTDKKDKS